MSYQINNYEDLKKTYEQQFLKLIKEKPYKNLTDKYNNLITTLLNNVNIKSPEENYQSFEFLTIKSLNIALYNSKEEEKEILNKIYDKFSIIFTNEKIEDKYLSFVKKHILENPYSDNTESYLDILNKIINLNKSQDKIINNIKETLKQKESDELAIYLLELIKKHHSQEEAILEAQNYLYCPQICDYLLEYYHDDPRKAKDLLVKIINETKQDNSN